MYRKNTAGQFVSFQGVDATTGGIKSGVTWAVRRCIDGTFAAGGGTVTEDSTNGWYKYALSQADTNGNNVSLNFTGSGAVPQTVNLVTTAADPTDGVHFGLSCLPNTACTTNASILTSGTGTDQVSVSAGKVLLQATQSGVTIPTVTTVTNQLTAAAIATGVWQDTTSGDFTTAGSIGKSLFTSGNAPGAASGLAIVGSNVGAATSVSGSVGSVTGNVGGNVTGSVGSVVGAVGSVTAGVTVTTNSDKTGYSVTQSFPTNFSALGITAGGHVSNVDTLTTYTGDTPQTGDSYARLGAPAGASVSADVAAVKAKTDNLPATPASTTNITAGTVTTVTNLTNAPTNGDFTTAMKTSLDAATPAATLAAGAITDATFTVPAAAAGRPSGILGMIRRLFERRENKQTFNRTTSVQTTYDTDLTTVLDTETFSTTGMTDSKTQAS